MKGTIFMEEFKSKMLRCYPNGTRIQSSNYCPTQAWCLGIQMAAMNFQTPGIYCLNNGFFSENAKSGYILMPQQLIDGEYNKVHEITPDVCIKFSFKLSIICGRNIFGTCLFKNISAYIYVSIFGAPIDENSKNSFTTKSIENAFTPFWNSEPHEFNLYYPQLALIYISIKNNANSIESKSLGHALLVVEVKYSPESVYFYCIIEGLSFLSKPYINCETFFNIFDIRIIIDLLNKQLVSIRR
ncbi:hypothetical protein HZS_4213 [Henneguya salminicola]|nr:hypothetical protein HZS_4213 [Henneguya salminicola]